MFDLILTSANILSITFIVNAVLLVAMVFAMVFANRLTNLRVK